MRGARTAVCSVLVIGSGAAGMRAAIAAHEAGAHAVIVGKRPGVDAHTVLASGGINGALGTRDPEDTWQQHYADTVREGYFLAHPRVVEIMAQEAPRAILELAEWGCEFARTQDGHLDQRYFGAHRYRRTCYAGDYTGRAILRTLHDRAKAIGLAPVVEDTYVAKLLVEEQTCFGALTFDMHTGDRVVFLADAVVLCSGGHTRLWRRSSSRRDENFGEGFGLALEAGCTAMDMELVQFHPTGMVFPEEAAGTLVTEAVRGEGGRLFNADGERYMERYDPERLELSSRDRVALANYTEIAEGRGSSHGGVFLDVSHIGKDAILEKLPRMYRQFIEYQMLDIARAPMEVAPTAHYTMGGLVVDPESHATEVRGLYAAGEVTGGLHGANRLGGNSLAETIISGRRAGEAAAAFADEDEVIVRSRRVIRQAMDEVDALVGPGAELARPLQRRLRDLMWETCGVVRNEEDLERGLRELDDIRASLAEVDVRPGAEGWSDLAHALDLRGGLLAAEATLRGALERRETRGAHNRSDFAFLDQSLQVNYHARLRDGRMTIEAKRVPDAPPELAKLVEKAPRVEAGADRLLE
jgi:succinate dehydrogenase / fumarate reductase flavoprotein subunit